MQPTATFFHLIAILTKVDTASLLACDGRAENTGEMYGHGGMWSPQGLSHNPIYVRKFSQNPINYL
jgi:hypothetical protein